MKPGALFWVVVWLYAWGVLAALGAGIGLALGSFILR